MSKKILLLSPPNDFLENAFSSPRMGLIYLGTILKQAGHEITIKHLSGNDELIRIAQDDFDCIGISATTYEYMSAVEILNYLKREQHPAKVIIGGPHVTALPSEGLNNGFDLIVAGEADLHIADLVSKKINDRRIVSCGYVKDLDILPIPDRTLIDTDKPWKLSLGQGDLPNTQIAGIALSRGCPYKCSFCGPHFPYRRRKLLSIEAELHDLSLTGYTGLVVLDDLPFISKEQVAEFCKLVKFFRMPFRCNFRADLLTPQVVELLAAADCSRVQIGVESVSPNILTKVNKENGAEDAGRAVLLCRAHNIPIKAMFVFGLPGDGADTANSIITFVREYQPDEVQLSVFSPLPGSPLWKEYSSRVTTYKALSFFSKYAFKELGVGNDRLTSDEVVDLKNYILKECEKFSHL